MNEKELIEQGKNALVIAFTGLQSLHTILEKLEESEGQESGPDAVEQFARREVLESMNGSTLAATKENREVLPLFSGEKMTGAAAAAYVEVSEGVLRNWPAHGLPVDFEKGKGAGGRVKRYDKQKLLAWLLDHYSGEQLPPLPCVALSIDAAGWKLKKSWHDVRKLVESGKLPALSVGSRFWVFETDAAEYLEARKD